MEEASIMIGTVMAVFAASGVLSAYWYSRHHD
jgi:hypothetical protein